MDYFNDDLTTFLGLECDSFIAVCRVSMQYAVCRLMHFSKNILICVSKMNEGLTGLERHEGE